MQLRLRALHRIVIPQPEDRRSASVTAPRRMAALANRVRRWVRSAPNANFSNRFARCCLTAASLTTSSVAISLIDAGSVNRSRASRGRQSTTNTSRSRPVSAGGRSSTSVRVAATSVELRNSSFDRPTRISSPCRRRCALQMRSPFTKVPLDEPRSTTHQPSANSSSEACNRLTVVSSSTISFPAPLPTVTRPPARSTRRTPSSVQISTVAGSMTREHKDSRGPTIGATKAGMR